MFTPKQLIESLSRLIAEHPEIADTPVKLKLYSLKRDKRRCRGYRYDTLETNLGSVGWHGNPDAGQIGEVNVTGTIDERES